MTEELRIAAAVVTYNRKELLAECVGALLEQTYPVDILIIDNASTDGTRQELEELICQGKVQYINTGANLGGAGGFHVAVKEAVSRKYDYIWLMDDDTIPEKDALSALVQALKDTKGNFGFLSSKAVWKDGNVCRMNEQKFLDSEVINGKKFTKCRQATFVSLFLPSRVVLQIGLPIKEFFIWGDDVEYTRRISEKYVCYYVPESVVLHKTANNEGSNIATDDVSRMDRYRYAYRNEVYIARKENLSRKLYQISKIAFHIVRVILKSHGYRWKKIKIIVGASVEGLKFRPSVEYIERN
ncbi:MAG TPA: glycosyltransferase family 2 protein [Candidatus Fusicatenibacter merdavium]|uniref:Glycosyltransferase family 2 protein n=1 Tax=Candidatus Fusicatenibacter merdavium TaxID=2838600 RepID=A0A9D2BHC1_9FIRM|nr:glycosyltransferase family 2 protein [Candidatus Fusicatenibacter merdavium]